MTEVTDGAQKKRKIQDGPEIEIDVTAPEPQSKKALRKSKKKKTDEPGEDGETKPEKPQNNAKPETQQEKRSEYGIWIGNLGFATTRDDLVNFFVSGCSFPETTITRIHLPKGPERYGRPQNKGFAYIDFSTKKALDEAIGMSEQLLTGRRVLIKNAKSFEGRPDKPQDQGNAAKPGHPPSRRIFVGNLSFDATKELLEEHFSQCGTVTNVHMATFQDTGKCKGYGWVEFEDIAAAEAAVKGYVLIEEEEEEEDSDESDSEKKRKKTPKRKVWVNQILGRRMRMEFAEDASTRYKKRFGKDAEGKNENSENGERSDEQPRFKKPRRQEIDDSRYSKETVQRLSGAIVEGQGSKVTFD